MIDEKQLLELAKLKINNLEEQVKELKTDLDLISKANALFAEENIKLAEALRLLERQNHGRLNNWAGMWFDCDNCKFMYSAMGNWLAEEHKCPQCNAKKILKEVGAE